MESLQMRDVLAHISNTMLDQFLYKGFQPLVLAAFHFAVQIRDRQMHPPLSSPIGHMIQLLFTGLTNQPVISVLAQKQEFLFFCNVPITDWATFHSTPSLAMLSLHVYITIFVIHLQYN